MARLSAPAPRTVPRLDDWANSRLKARPAAAGSPEAAEWAVFVAYRGLLDELGAADDAGMSVWASKRLAQPTVLGGLEEQRRSGVP